MAGASGFEGVDVTVKFKPDEVGADDEVDCVEAGELNKLVAVAGKAKPGAGFDSVFVSVARGLNVIGNPDGPL